MGKIGGSSWLTVVKRAFRSPTKEAAAREKRSSRRREEHEQDHEEEKVTFFCVHLKSYMSLFTNVLREVCK